jgi:hypothetical protein
MVAALLDDDERLAVFDRLNPFSTRMRSRCRAMGRDLVHRLHRLDDEHSLALGDARADVTKATLAGLGRG